MNSVFQVQPSCSAADVARLRALQHEFARACNTLAPIARDTRCWNRVALHHMCYRMLRERFPSLGSQMACNAIYSVSRACRAVYQSAASPFNLAKLGDRPLPLVQFEPDAPVYFDRHTLSLKNGRLSMFTLDGRIRIELGLSAEDERRFHEEKLREIVLSSRGDAFTLSFVFGATESGDDAALWIDAPAATQPPAPSEPIGIPGFLRIVPEPVPTHTGAPS